MTEHTPPPAPTPPGEAERGEPVRHLSIDSDDEARSGTALCLSGGG